MLSLAEDTFIRCYDSSNGFHLKSFKFKTIKNRRLVWVLHWCRTWGFFNLLSQWRFWSWALAYIKYWKCARWSTLADHRSHKRNRQKNHLRKVSPTVTDLQTPIFLVIKFLSHTHTPILTLLTLTLTGTPYKRTTQTHAHTHTLNQTYSTICAHARSHKH